MKSVNDLRVKFRANGFVPGSDISEDEWSKTVAEYVMLYNMFAENHNAILDQTNKIWDTYEEIKKKDSIGVDTLMTQFKMGITNETSYNDWNEKWMKQIVEVINNCTDSSGFGLKGIIFRDGDMPLFGAEFKNNCNWTIDMYLVPAEE